MEFYRSLIFYGASFAAAGATTLVLVSSNPVYAVLYLVMSLFSVSLVFYALGAVFLAVLEVLVYAGAIMVLFLFVVMMLNLGAGPISDDVRRPSRRTVMLPAVFAGLLVLLTVGAIAVGTPNTKDLGHRLTEKELGQVLYNRHYLGVELVSLILTIGMIGGMHLGKAASGSRTEPAFLDTQRDESPGMGHLPQHIEAGLEAGRASARLAAASAPGATTPKTHEGVSV